MKTNQTLNILLVILITAIYIFIYTPLRFHIADPNLYLFTAGTLRYLSFQAGLYISVLTLFFYLLKKLSSKIAFSLLYLCFTLFSYSVLFSLDYGPIHGVSFRDNYHITHLNQFNNLFIIISAMLTTYLIMKHHLYNFFLFLSVCLLSSSLLLNLVNLKKTSKKTYEQTYSTQDLNKDKKFSLHLSKENLNVIIFMLDMFSGDRFGKILYSEKTILNDFNGYTWYPDTLSVASTTVAGELAITGGYKRTPLIINSKMNKQPIQQLWYQEFSPLINLFQHTHSSKNNDIFNIINPVPYTGGCNNIIKSSSIDHKKIRLLCTKSKPPLYKNYHNIFDYQMLHITPLFGIFYSLPPMFKKDFYSSTFWKKFTTQKRLPLWEAEWNKEESRILSELTTNINISDKTGRTLSFIHSNLTHNPFLLKDNCEVPTKKEMTDNLINKNKENYVINNSKCTLMKIATLNNHLKSKQIYDNTVIILVSDHNNNDSEMLSKAIPESNISSLQAAHALLAIKWPNHTSPLNKSKELMSNSDIIDIISCLLGSNNHEKGCRLNTKNRVRYNAHIRSHIETPEKTSFRTYDEYLVYGSMFSPKSWKLLSKKEVYDIEKSLEKLKFNIFSKTESVLKDES